MLEFGPIFEWAGEGPPPSCLNLREKPLSKLALLFDARESGRTFEQARIRGNVPPQCCLCLDAGASSPCHAHAVRTSRFSYEFLFFLLAIRAHLVPRGGAKRGRSIDNLSREPEDQGDPVATGAIHRPPLGRSSLLSSAWDAWVKTDGQRTPASLGQLVDGRGKGMGHAGRGGRDHDPFRRSTGTSSLPTSSSA